MHTTLQYCSDLHLEFDLNRKWLAKHPLAVKADVLLLGGDIMPLAEMARHGDFLNYVSSHFRTTYWIPGNHDFMVATSNPDQAHSTRRCATMFSLSTT